MSYDCGDGPSSHSHERSGGGRSRKRDSRTQPVMLSRQGRLNTFCCLRARGVATRRSAGSGEVAGGPSKPVAGLSTINSEEPFYSCAANRWNLQVDIAEGMDEVRHLPKVSTTKPVLASASQVLAPECAGAEVKFWYNMRREMSRIHISSASL